jgi:glutaredoxin 3
MVFTVLGEIMYTIYTKTNCSYCVKAKELLSSKGLQYLEKNIEDPDLKAELFARYPEVKTVPQIYLYSAHLGGYDDLVRYFEQTL